MSTILRNKSRHFEDGEISSYLFSNQIEFLDKEAMEHTETKAIALYEVQDRFILRLTFGLCRILNNYYVRDVKGNINKDLESNLDKVIATVSNYASVLHNTNGPISVEIIEQIYTSGPTEIIEKDIGDGAVSFIDLNIEGNDKTRDMLAENLQSISAVRQEESPLVMLKAIGDILFEITTDISTKTEGVSVNPDNDSIDEGAISDLKRKIKLMSDLMNSSSYFENNMYAFDDEIFNYRMGQSLHKS